MGQMGRETDGTDVTDGTIAMSRVREVIRSHLSPVTLSKNFLKF